MPDAAVHEGVVVPRSVINLGVEPALRRKLAQLADGRVLVIDYFASRRCSVVIGDLTAEFERRSPGRGYLELASIEGIRVLVEARLMPVLRSGEATLVSVGPPFARHLSVRLERPERWIDFLDQPGVLLGKRRYRMFRR